MQKEIKSNEQLKTLLFLQLELQVLEKVYPVFSDLLFFYAKYSFLFETTSPEPISSNPAHTKFETLCSTPDPARDGGNWYGYAGQNPVTYKDPTGLAYYGPDGVHSSSEAPTPHGETNKNIVSKVVDSPTIYFIYNYSSEWERNQEFQVRERKTINDDVKYLEKTGFNVNVFDGKNGSEPGSKENIQKALEDKNTIAIIFSGHGIKYGGISTYDDDNLYPEDVSNFDLSKKLQLIIFENCYQKGSDFGLSDNLNKWQNVFGEGVTIVGWENETYVTETMSFNRLGLFDRQKKNLRGYLKELQK